MREEHPLWLEVKRALVFVFGIVPGLAISAIGFVAGFACKMFVWGFYRGAKLLEVFDRRPGELYGDFDEALNEALVERNVQGVQTKVQRPMGP